LPLSVVIPTLGRPQLLQRCLGSLARSEWDEGTLEIVVVDDGPNEATREAVARWMPLMAQRGMVVRYLPSPGPHGPAAARNQGWRAACGRIIAFTDDDTEPEPGWLRAGLKAFVPGAEAAWGRTVMPLPSVPTDYSNVPFYVQKRPLNKA
jgi:glycosyltransferase involved in cell wall biosynthesis